MAKYVKSFQYGKHQVRLETGEIARQADGAVMVAMGDTQVLVTAVGAKSAKPGQDFPVDRSISGKNLCCR